MNCPNCNSDKYTQAFYREILQYHNYYCAKCKISFVSKVDWEAVKEEKRKITVSKLLYSEMVED